MFIRSSQCVLAVLAFLGASLSPTIGVSPDPLSAGGTATITISGGTPDSSVTVSINNGASPPNTKSDSVPVTLDANGDGQATWPVPASGWSTAIFSTPGASDVNVLITGAGGTG
jgi:hypothetical protein